MERVLIKQVSPMGKLMNESVFAGWGRRIRTFPTRSRAGCPTARLSPSDLTQSKSRRFPGVVNGILPLNLPLKEPQKRAGEGLQIQSLLSNPPNTPIISPHPTDINARPPYFSLARLKSYYQTLTRRTEKSVFVQMTRVWMLANYGGREVILC